MTAWHALGWALLIAFVDWNIAETKRLWQKMARGEDSDDSGNC
jgi:hypothetical protein